MRKPEWLKAEIPHGPVTALVQEVLERRKLNTVCVEARCPNRAECWGCGTATFMLLGAICTRGCRFCAVATAKNGEPVRPDEPREIADAVRELSLKFAVITSVDRDDLQDRGAGHFAACIMELRKISPAVGIEALIPDYDENELVPIIASKPDVIAHNIETVRRLQTVRDGRASFEKSLDTLSSAARMAPSITIKSSIMLGLGETESELGEAMDALIAAGCTSLVLGQYLRPGPGQIEVSEYVHPDTFLRYGQIAREKGFVHVIAKPFARTSYHAERMFGAE